MVLLHCRVVVFAERFLAGGPDLTFEELARTRRCGTRKRTKKERKTDRKTDKKNKRRSVSRKCHKQTTTTTTKHKPLRAAARQTITLDTARTCMSHASAYLSSSTIFSGSGDFTIMSSGNEVISRV
jgi:hypothetical protein